MTVARERAEVAREHNLALPGISGPYCAVFGMGCPGSALMVALGALMVALGARRWLPWERADGCPGVALMVALGAH